MQLNQELKYWTDNKTESEAKYKVISNSDFDNRTNRDVELISENLKITSEDIVLDFGVGVGRLMKNIAPKCKMLLGTDISESMIRYGITYCKGINNALFKAMYSDCVIPINDKSIDKIYSLLVLQHIDKRKINKILYEFSRILKMNGKVFLQFPNLMKNKNEYQSQMRYKIYLGDNSPRMEFFIKEEIEWLFEDTGLRILKLFEEDSDFYILAEKIEDRIPQLCSIQTSMENGI